MDTAHPPATATPGRAGAGSRRRLVRVVLLLLVGLGLLRLIHLTADTPPWVSPHSAGEYVDEGYKTLSPRNLALYGRTHWHPADDYTGWMKTSPLTNGSYYLAFRLGQPDLATARIVTILYFSGFLACFALAAARRLPPALVVGGVLLLGLDSALFVFSRIALFEIPIVFFLYGGLFLLSRAREDALWWPLAASVIAAPVLAFGLKLSALVYVAPVWIALAGRAVFLKGVPRSPLVIAGALAGVAGVVWMMVVTHWLWSGRLELHPFRFVGNLLRNPLPSFTPFLFLAGWLAALHLALTRFRDVIASSYRSAVLAIALLGPLILGLFPYDPPRYYVPILPAYALVVCEWVALNGRRLPVPPRGWLPGLVAVAGLTLWFFAAARVANDFLLVHLPLAAGEAPGIGLRGLMLTALPLAFVLAVVCWLRRSRSLVGPLIQAGIIGSLVLWAVHGAWRIGDLLTEPRYQGDVARNQLVAAVPPQSTLAGDWAPFFALGTDLRPLYMNHAYNHADRIGELRPDYFLHSDTGDSHASLAVLQADPAVQLGAPVLETAYNDHPVIVYPLRYDAPEKPAQPDDPRAVAPAAAGPASGG